MDSGRKFGLRHRPHTWIDLSTTDEQFQSQVKLCGRSGEEQTTGLPHTVSVGAYYGLCRLPAHRHNYTDRTSLRVGDRWSMDGSADVGYGIMPNRSSRPPAPAVRLELSSRGTGVVAQS